MAKPEEIREWWKAAFTQPRLNSNITDSFFFEPRHQPDNTPDCTTYARCLPEQQLMVLCELTAQLAELNENLMRLSRRVEIKHCPGCLNTGKVVDKNGKEYDCPLCRP